MLLRSLQSRDRRPELMDDPAIDPGEHRRALAGLARLNRASRIVPTVEREILARCGDGPLSILDVAAGSGDLLFGLAKNAARAGRPWTFSACDISETACETIRSRSEATGHTVDVEQRDALGGDLPKQHDLVMCHLFLHHLDDEQIISLLGAMRASARLGVLITDLSRSSLGYTLAYIASRTLTRSRVVHTDALISVRGALNASELRDAATQAGLGGARIRAVWPERMLLWWDA